MLWSSYKNFVVVLFLSFVFPDFCVSKPGGSGKLAEIKRAMRNKIGDSGRIRSALHNQQRLAQSSMTIEFSAVPNEEMSLWQQSPEVSTLSHSDSFNNQRYTSEDSSQGAVAQGWNPDEDQGAQLKQTMYLQQEDLNIVMKREPNEEDYM